MVVLHAPTAADPARCGWWVDFKARLSRTVKRDALVLLGDFNARFTHAIPSRVGDLVWEKDQELPIGLESLLAEHDLWIPATFSECHVGDSVTWLAPGTGASSRIDFIIIPVGWCCKSGSSRVLLDVDFGQTGIDHFGVYLSPEACLACDVGVKRMAPKIDVAQLAAPGASAVVERICAAAPDVQWHVDAHTHYDRFSSFLATELCACLPWTPCAATQDLLQQHNLGPQAAAGLAPKDR